MARLYKINEVYDPPFAIGIIQEVGVLTYVFLLLIRDR